MEGETASMFVLLSKIMASMMLGTFAFIVLSGTVVVMAEESPDPSLWAILVHGSGIARAYTSYYVIDS